MTSYPAHLFGPKISKNGSAISVRLSLCLHLLGSVGTRPGQMISPAITLNQQQVITNAVAPANSNNQTNPVDSSILVQLAE